jgi:lysozyme
MPNRLVTSTKGRSLIKKWEGLRLEAYLCPANVWTIGYGHTGGVLKGQTVTEAEANDLLTKDLKRFEDAVNFMVKVTLNQNQFDALVSFTYNVGTGALSTSTLLTQLNKGNYTCVPAQLRRWNKAGSRVLEGLKKRREDEVKLWLQN